MKKAFIIIAAFLLALSYGHMTMPSTQRHIRHPARGLMAESDIVVEEANDEPAAKGFTIVLENYNNSYYIGNVSIGEDTTLRVMFNTGNDNTWIVGDSCDSCQADTKYNCSASSTCFLTGGLCYDNWRSGDIRGDVGYEMMGFTQDAKANTSLAFVTSSTLKTEIGIDGVIGLQRVSKDTDMVSSAFLKGYIKDSVFSFRLDYNSDSTKPSSNSSLTVGYIPEDIVNNLTWIKNWNYDKFQFLSGAWKIDEAPIHNDTLFSTTYLDSTALTNILSSTMMKEIKAKLDTLDNIPSGEDKMYRCDADYLKNYPNATMFLDSGEQLNLTVFDYMSFANTTQKDGKNYCRIGAQSTDGVFTLGMPFFRNNDLAFSKQNYSVGIYQSYKPIILPPAPAPLQPTNWLLRVGIVVLIAALVGAVIFALKKRQEGAKELDRLLNNEEGAPINRIAV